MTEPEDLDNVAPPRVHAGVPARDGHSGRWPLIAFLVVSAVMIAIVLIGTLGRLLR